jgi:ribosome-associated protein
MPEDLEIRRGLVIPGEELREAASRSGGPGGQHVNKASTRVTLRWRLGSSSAVSEAQRARLRRRLASRLTRADELVVHAGGARSRARNRERARERLAELVREGLAVRRARRPTRPSGASRERRLEGKRRRASVKSTRGGVRADSD